MRRNAEWGSRNARHRSHISAAVVLLTLAAWGPPVYAATPASEQESAIDQKNLCEVDSWRFDEVAAACKPGQKVAFLPKNFGNEQLPVIFAAVNCDLRYSVVLTTGAVTCIYGPITPVVTEPAKQ